MKDAIFRARLRQGTLDDAEIEIDLVDAGKGGMPTFYIPGMPGAQMGMINLSDMMGKAFGAPTKTKKMLVKDVYDPLIAEESDKLLDDDQLSAEALSAVENDGIVFLDEIDKVARSSERSGADVSREGVQRDLLPLIEGSVVSTKYGPVKTDHILFVASGAFHVAKPADLLPELQGRLPIRVELGALTEEDFVRILTDTEASLPKQYTALMATEGLNLTFTEDGINRLAEKAAEVNSLVENIGARRLSTILERVLEEVSFDAADRKDEKVTVDAAFVDERLKDVTSNADLSKYIL